MRKTNQEKLRIAALVSKAAIQFLKNKPPPSPEWDDETHEVVMENETGCNVGHRTREQNDATHPMIESLEVVMDIEPGSNVDHRTQGSRNGWTQKVSLEWIFVITNFILELPSAVLDQLSSEHKTQYALFAMLISFSAFVICIVKLIYKVRKERVCWRQRVILPWLYYTWENHKPFGSFRDIFGSVCAFCQCIVTAINYSQSDHPIKISVWPIVFAFGLLCSKMLENQERVVIS